MKRTHLIDSLIIAALVMSMTVITWRFANGFPIGNDDLLYMSLAQHPQPGAIRYFHIYFLKLCTWLAPPLIAAKLFWATTTTLTVVLVYINARHFSRATTLLHGLMAVWLFLATQAVFVYAGSPLADYSFMMLTAIGITLYQCIFRLQRWRTPLLVALGVVLFCATESKEIGMCLAILLAGIGFADGDTFQGRTFVKHGLLVGSGLLAGFLLFVVLHALIIDHPWQWFDNVKRTIELIAAHPVPTLHRASLLLASLVPVVPPDVGSIAPLHAQLPDFFTLPSRHVIEYYTWYEALMNQGGVLLVTVLFIVSGIKETPAHTRADRILWLFPPAVFLALTIAGVRVTFSGERHFMAALVVMSILAVQFIPLEYMHRNKRIAEQRDKHDVRELSISWRALAHLLGLVVLALAAALLVWFAINHIAARYFLHTIDIYRGYIYPVSLVCLLSLFLWVRQWKAISVLIGLVCACLISVYTLLQTPTVMREISAIGRTRLAFYHAFADHIDITDGMYAFVSLNSTNFKYEVWSDNYIRIFEAFFHRKVDNDQFIITTSRSTPGTADYPYSYIFLAKDDWYALSDEQRQRIEATATVTEDPTCTMVFAATASYVLTATEQTLATNPANVHAYTNRAEAYLTQGYSDTALVEFNHALAINPDDVRALLGRGRTHARMGNADAAVQDVSRILVQHPNHADALFARGVVYAEQGNTAQAAADFDRMLTPMQPYPHTHGLRFVEDYDTIIALLPSYAPAYLMRGLFYEQRDNVEQARADYSQAIALDPAWYAPYASRGSLSLAQQAWQDAVDDLSLALRLMPDEPVFYGCSEQPIHFTNGFAAAVSKRQVEVSGMLAECLYFERGTAYANLGNSDNATADFRTVRRITTDAALYAQAQEEK